MVLVMLKPEQH